MSSPLIVLCGFVGSGKSTVANHLVSRGFTQLNFADTIKDIISSLFTWDRELLAGITPESRKWREETDKWWSDKLGFQITPRWAMQNIGTDVFRKHFSDNIWVASLERKISTISGPVVIGDARFPNEIEAMRKLGGKVVMVERGPKPFWYGAAVSLARNEPSAWMEYMKSESLPHISEVAWLGVVPDIVLDNNETVEELIQKIDKSI